MHAHPRLVGRMVLVATILEIIVVLVDRALFQIGHIFARIRYELGIGAAARHPRVVAMLDDAANTRPPCDIVRLNAGCNVSARTVFATQKIAQIVDGAKFPPDPLVAIHGTRCVAIVPRVANDAAGQGV